MSEPRILLGCLLMGIALLPARAQAGWCRLDDPAPIELQRKSEGLRPDQLEALPCPTGGDVNADERPTELVLPLPCGRRMVFRRVDLELEDLLDQVAGAFGAVADDSAQSDGVFQAVTAGPWSDQLAGSFSDGSGSARRHFYIGKYEVTEPQFALLADGVFANGTAESEDDALCAPARERAEQIGGTRVFPATGMTWLEAQQFAFAWTEWLLTVDRSRQSGAARLLPFEESAPGFLRLPTETEWEYAARAGAVDPESRARQVYQVRDAEGALTDPQVEEIAAFSSVQKEPPEGRSVFYVGRLTPNLFGLYDMVGNAEEMVFDLFRPTRPDMLGGQRGGFVMRGGSSLDAPATLGVGARREQPFFDQQGPLRAEVAGFRLVVSAPWFAASANAEGGAGVTNKAFLDGLEKARARLLAAPSPNELAGASKAADDVERLRAEYAEETKRLKADREADGVRLVALEQELAHAREVGGQRSELEQLVARSQDELGQAAAVRRESEERVAQLNLKLATLQASLEKSAAQVAEYDREVRREQFASALFVANGINNLFRRMRLLGSTIKAAQTESAGRATPAQRQKAQRQIGEARLGIARLRELRAAQFSHYVTLVSTLAEAEPQAVEAADRTVSTRLGAPLAANLASLRQKLKAHVEAMATGHGAVPGTTLDRWLEEMEEVDRR